MLPFSSPPKPKNNNIAERLRAASATSITEEVACELSKVVERHGLSDELTPVAKKWIELHKIADAYRS